MKSMFSDEPVVHIAVKEEGGSVTMWNGVKTGIKELSENWNRTKGSKGSKVWDCQDEVSISIDGDARIAAIGNGNIFGDEISTTDNTCHLYKGTALVILRSALKPSTVTLRVSSPKFKTVTCKLISLHQLSIISAK